MILNRKNERNNSVNIRNRNTEKEEQRKKLIEKIAIIIKMKYSKMFKEINYDIRDFISDLNVIVKVTDVPFEAYLIQIEKAVLAKISKKKMMDNPSQSSKKLIDMNKINSLIEDPLSDRQKNQISNRNSKSKKRNVKSVINRKINNTIELDSKNNKIIQLNTIEANKPYLSEKPSAKLEEIMVKREDEWAKLANHNFNKYQEELQKNRIKEEEKKKQMRENLGKQILEKTSAIQKEKEMENLYIRQHLDLMNKHDTIEKMKKEEILNKFKSEKEIRDKIVKDSKQVRKKVEEIEEKEEKMMLDRIKKDQISEEEKSLKKRENEKEMYKKLIADNDNRQKIKREETEKERIENIKALENYSKLIEKQDAERLTNKQNRVDKMKNQLEKVGELITVDQRTVKFNEEKRFLKEQKENERRELEKEKEEQEKRRILNIEIKNTLDKQIIEKRAKFEEIKNKDKEFDKEIYSQINRYNVERDEKISNLRERTKKYKDELSNQVNEKLKYRIPTMDEKERQINKIDEILQIRK